ncbi:MAG: type II secretion system secretin GspD [Gammaproteobacteria bacterium]|nr:type II secretion system secretin GspD [Gammaproteobacteria bacterium]
MMLFRYLALRSCAIVLCVLPLLCSPASAQEATPAAGLITLNLENADIRALISTVSEITGRNFVVDPRVRGEVTVISAAGTTPEAIYDIFLSILRVNGFVAVDSGSVVKILPSAIARQEGGDFTSAPDRLPLDQLVTAVIPIQNGDAASIVPVIRPLLANEAHVAAHAAGNVLLVADSAGNIERIIDIVRRIDRRASQYDFEVIPLRFAVADRVVALLTQLAAATTLPGQPQAPVPVVPDPRTNSLLVGGTDAEKLRYRALVSSLDVEVAEDGGIEVINLRFASAEELAPLLQDIFSGGRSVATVGANVPGGVAASGGAGNSGEVKIQADLTNNALVIQGSPEVIRRVRQVIAQLDVRRNQVLVEGVIAEVKTTTVDELGIQWRTAPRVSGIVAGSNNPGTFSVDSGALLEDGPTSLFGTAFTLGFFSNGNIRALLQALSSDQYTNVLSTPTLVTLDNAEASIVVGQNVPFVTGQYTNNSTTPDNPFQTIERQDVGVILHVKPQINDGNTVTLEIEQEVSSIDRATSGLGLITNQRNITTTVLVDDGQTVVLGGLISDELREGQQKIPVLGDIPVLGTLFRSTRNDGDKTNLMVFLRPTVLQTPERAAQVTDQRMEFVREKQQVQQQRPNRLFLNPTPPSLDTFDGLLE